MQCLKYGQKLKLVLFLSGLSFCLNSYPDAQEQRYRLTRCLGREELKLHKTKIEDFNYYLNQILLSHMVQLDGATLKDPYFIQACSDRKNNSYKVLEVFLTHFENSFQYLATEKSKNYSKSLVSKFVLQLPDILTEFMIHVKKNSPDAQCIKKYVPELLQLEQNIMDLQGDMDFKQIIWRDNLIQKVLNKLKNQTFFYGKCLEEKKK